MKSRALILLVAACALAADKPNDEAAKKVLTQVQGDWVAVKAQMNGESAPPQRLKRMKVAFKGDQITISNPNDPATITFDPSQKPTAMDITAPANEKNAKPEHMQGIYKLDGDDLTICIGKPGAARPTDFVSKPGGGTMVMVLKRDKK